MMPAFMAMEIWLNVQLKDSFEEKLQTNMRKKILSPPRKGGVMFYKTFGSKI